MLLMRLLIFTFHVKLASQRPLVLCFPWSARHEITRAELDAAIDEKLAPRDEDAARAPHMRADLVKRILDFVGAPDVDPTVPPPPGSGLTDEMIQRTIQELEADCTREGPLAPRQPRWISRGVVVFGNVLSFQIAEVDG